MLQLMESEKLVTELCKTQDYLLLNLQLSCAPSYYKIGYRLQQLGEEAARFWTECCRWNWHGLCSCSSQFPTFNCANVLVVKKCEADVNSEGKGFWNNIRVLLTWKLFLFWKASTNSKFSVKSKEGQKSDAKGRRKCVDDLWILTADYSKFPNVTLNFRRRIFPLCLSYLYHCWLHGYFVVV